MTTIRNRSNSPFDLLAVGGAIRLPPMGEVSGRFSDDYLALLKAGRVVEVSEDEEKLPARPRGRQRKE